MGKFSGYLIVSDIDGTLFNSSYICPEENLKAIEYFKSEGGLFTLASGRSLYNVSVVGEGLCNTELIGFNGSAIGKYRDVRLGFRMPEGFREDLALLKEKLPFADMKFLTPEGTFVFDENEYTLIHKCYITEKQMTPLKSISDAPDDTMMVAIWMSEDRISEATEIAKEMGLHKKYEFVKGFRLAFELIPLGGGKGRAGKELKKLKNCHTLITAGDNYNDISMLKAADISFAPRNAVEEIKKAATVSLKRDCNEGIFPEIIEYLERNQEK